MGTTQRLSISMSMLLIFLTNDCQPLLGFLWWYIGYSSAFVIVSLKKFFWKLLDHFPFALQGNECFRLLHGPWIMFAVTMSNSIWSIDWSGISAYCQTFQDVFYRLTKLKCVYEVISAFAIQRNTSCNVWDQIHVIL